MTTWALEAELWGGGPGPGDDLRGWLEQRSDAELVHLVRLAAGQLASLRGRSPREVVAEIAGDSP